MTIEGDMSIPLRDSIRKTLSWIVPNFKHGKWYKEELKRATAEGREPSWDGSKTCVNIFYSQGNAGLRAPTGLLSYVWELLKENNIPFKIINEREIPPKSYGYSLQGLTLRDYQLDAQENSINKTRGVLKIACGGGKTEIAVSMTEKIKTFPVIFYVTSKDLLRQTKERFEKYFLYNGIPIKESSVKIGIIGDGQCDIQDITICTVQSAERALTGKITKNEFDDYHPDDKTIFSEQQKKNICDLIKSAKVIIVDECHHVSAETIQTILNNSFSAYYRYGLSASPWRDDGLDILIEACFGRRTCDITASYLIQKGFLLRPNITYNHFRQQLGATANYQAHYTKYIVENEKRNKFIAERARFHLDLNRPTIILVKWTKHATILKNLIEGSEVLTSSGEDKKSATKREKILNRMRSRELMCIIGTSLLDEGVDVPSITSEILAGGGKSSTRQLQRVGRPLRIDTNDPTKTEAYIEDFFDHTRYLDHHSNLRKKILETEPEFKIFHNMETMNL